MYQKDILQLILSDMHILFKMTQISYLNDQQK